MIQKIEIFSGYWVFVTDSVKKINKQLLRIEPDTSLEVLVDNHNPPNGRAFWVDSEKGYFLAMYLRKPISRKTVIHESVHIISYLMGYLDIHDEEFKAVATAYLSEKILKDFNV